MSKMNVVVEKVSMFNPFSILGVEPSFNLDLSQVETNYLEQMKAYHPDKLAALEDAKEKLLLANKATQLNDAYNILQDEIKRGQVLIDLLKDEQHFNESIARNDSEFIFVQLQMREKIANLSVLFDESAFAALKEQARELREQNRLALTNAFTNNDLNLAQKLVYRLQFIAKLASEIEQVEDEQLF